MKFGFQMMLRGAAGTPEGMSAIARHGEALGFDVVAPNDHIIAPGEIDSPYPYSADGVWPGAALGECQEQLTALTFLAARTERLRLLTSVMVTPYRAPVLTAKIIATADLLSEGRVILGCGAGWMAEEFDALGAPPFSERGKVTDEYINIFKKLWREDNPTHEGSYARFDTLHFKPQPVQTPHPPIWIGGESKAALRRVARLGDGWYPVANNPKVPLGTPQQMADRLTLLRQICDEGGRDFDQLQIGYFYADPVSRHEQVGADGARRAMSGKASDIAADLHAFAEAGVGTFIAIFQHAELAPTLDQMSWFASEIMPEFRD